jgi:hypothetical protein
MTKQQLGQLKLIDIYIDNGMPDVAARVLSAMIRACLVKSTKIALMMRAEDLNLTKRAEFIV